MGLQAAQVPSPTVNSNHRRKRRNWQRLSCPWEPRKVRKAAAALAVATVLACFCFPALFLPLPLGSLPLSITSPKELMPSEVEDAAEPGGYGLRSYWSDIKVSWNYPSFSNDNRVGIHESQKIDKVRAQWIFRYNDYIKYSHMAMLERWGDILVAAWQASPAPRNLLTKADGSKEIVVEGLQEQRLLYSISRDAGDSWETPVGVQLLDGIPLAERGAVWSPVLHADANGKLWMFYSQSVSCRKTVGKEVTWSPGGDIRAVTLMNVKSLTAGLFDSSDMPSWSVPKVILRQADDGLPKVVANKLVVLSTGEWVLPFWREKPDGAAYRCSEDSTQVSSSGVVISGDGGSTWKAYGVLHDYRYLLLEGAVVELASQDILMLLRSSSGCTWRSVSKDKGKTWSQLQPTRLPNPNSKIHVIRIPQSGHLVLAYNNHKRQNSHLLGESDGYLCRTNLELAVSTDDGDSWNHLAVVDKEISPGVRIHYPTLQQADDLLYVAYSKFYLFREPGEWSLDQGIRVSCFNISKLMASPVSQNRLGVPSRETMLAVLDHFTSHLTSEDLAFIQARAFVRGGQNSRKTFDKRWKWVSNAICNRYDMERYGGHRWLVRRANFARYAVDRVWAQAAAMRQHPANASAALNSSSDFL